jgi:hypothetical protein
MVGPIPDHLPAELTSLAPDISVAEGQIVLNRESTSSKAKVLRILLDNGVDIRKLTERHASLEEVYLEATGR